MAEKKFKQYKLSNDIKEALEVLGYNEPTPIQQQTIPAILEGKDIVGKSQTGSGKTAAFAIPICEKVSWNERAPQALVLEPTRELAMQVRDEIFAIGRKRRLKVPVVLGGMPINLQINDLRQRSHIVVGTPGRVLDHIRRESIDLCLIKYLVIDEADLMLDMGFIEDVEQIIKACQAKPVMLLFSATMGEHLEGLVSEYMNKPVRITIESETETVSTITQEAYVISEKDKFNLLMDLFIVECPESSIIFCETREMVNVLYRQMKKTGIRCGMLHGGMEQRERLDTIEAFRVGKFPHLITTDVSARGVDFDKVTHVWNYDFPSKKENYVHRIGRTGRNGASGKSISFIEPQRKTILHSMENYTGAKILLRKPLSREEVEEKRAAFDEYLKQNPIRKEKKGAKLQEDIVKIAIGGGKHSKMRAGDIVGTICSIDDVSAEDIGIIDIRDAMSYVEILNGKGYRVLEELKNKTIKGKLRKVHTVRIK